MLKVGEHGDLQSPLRIITGEAGDVVVMPRDVHHDILQGGELICVDVGWSREGMGAVMGWVMGTVLVVVVVCVVVVIRVLVMVIIVVVMALVLLGCNACCCCCCCCCDCC